MAVSMNSLLIYVYSLCSDLKKTNPNVSTSEMTSLVPPLSAHFRHSSTQFYVHQKLRRHSLNQMQKTLYIYYAFFYFPSHTVAFFREENLSFLLFDSICIRRSVSDSQND